MAETSPFQDLQDALKGLQTTFRVNGLQQLAVLTPTEVQDETQLRRAHLRLVSLMRLMTLNPPAPVTLRRVTASLDRVVKLAMAVEEWLKSR